MTVVSRLYHLHLLSATHFGTGQSLDVIDQPVAREAATGLPIAPGSGVKGVLRDESPPAKSEVARVLFGPGPKETDSGRFKGALNVGDAWLLCLPVRSFAGTFAWVTCPLVLFRYARDWKAVGQQPPGVPWVDGKGEILTSQNTCLRVGGNSVFLEDLDLRWRAEATCGQWEKRLAEQMFPSESDADWSKLFQQRFALVHDDVFRWLCAVALEIRPRVQLDDQSGTVVQGPWYEECLPAETLMWGLLTLEAPHGPVNKVRSPAQWLEELPKSGTRLQLGGNATVGRGQAYWL